MSQQARSFADQDAKTTREAIENGNWLREEARRSVAIVARTASAWRGTKSNPGDSPFLSLCISMVLHEFIEPFRNHRTSLRLCFLAGSGNDPSVCFDAVGINGDVPFPSLDARAYGVAYAFVFHRPSLTLNLRPINRWSSDICAPAYAYLFALLADPLRVIL